jgi:hypothetical protein
MSVAILAHKLYRCICNYNYQIAQKNNFANNNNMLDAKGIIMMHVKIDCTRNPNHYEQGGGLDTGTYQLTKNKEIIFNRLIPTK